MKNLLVLMVLFMVSTTNAQIFGDRGVQQTDSWFSTPTKETLDSPNLIRLQHNLFIDPTGKPPHGGGGRQFGYEMTALMGWGSISPSISTFPQLKDGYTDLVVSFEFNFHMFNTTLIRYHAGPRLGFIFRGSNQYPLIGFGAGADIVVYQFPNQKTTILLGGKFYMDWREDQEDQFYGDSSVKRWHGLDHRLVGTGVLYLGFRF